MSATIALLRRSAVRVRGLWAALWAESRPQGPFAPHTDLGRLPVRPAIRSPAEATEEQPTATRAEAEQRLAAEMGRWPAAAPRLAIEAGTGLGKTTHAVAIAACHAAVQPACPGKILYVAHNKQRVIEVVGRIREAVAELHGNAALVAPLLGRQSIDLQAGQAWTSKSFGCVNHERVRLFGVRLRAVRREVCKPCTSRGTCESVGYLGHMKAALGAPVVVTTLARLTNLQDDVWASIGAVICDEDVVPGLLEDLVVLPSDLRRAITRIRCRMEAKANAPRPPMRLRALLPILPLLEACLDAVRCFKGKEPVPLVDLLPQECEPFLSEEGAGLIRRALPVRREEGEDGGAHLKPDERAMAEWERAGRRWTPRQVNGRFLAALANDVSLGDSRHAATVRVERGCGGRGLARIHITRFDERTLRELRRRPLLLLDATLHPAASALLDAEPLAIRCLQGRQIVQALTRLTDSKQLARTQGKDARLTDRGMRVVAQVAHWVNGHRAYVLCRKRLVKALEQEAARYYELRRTVFVTVLRERGWDAKKGADVFVVLGRYAKDPEACVREAHALRSVMRLLGRTTAGLVALELPARAPVFRGRGRPLSFYGALLERPRKQEMPDRLAQALQDADRLASVAQFIGRNRPEDAHVLLLRGDPTIAVDAIVHERDLPEALPAAEVARRRDEAARARGSEGVRHHA